IQGVDSLKLLREINKQAEKNGRVVDVLLQLHIATEETKFGLSKVELAQAMQSGEVDNLKHVRVKGLMGMASLTGDKEQVRREFHELKMLFDRYPEFSVLSMGMSGDYELAV